MQIASVTIPSVHQHGNVPYQLLLLKKPCLKLKAHILARISVEQQWVGAHMNRPTGNFGELH